MNRAMVSEVIRLGGDPVDPVWQWFLLRGPHGATFTWGQTRQQPPGYVGLEHLQEIVAERCQTDPDFAPRALTVARAALSSTTPEYVRRAIQVVAVLGDSGDLEALWALATDADDSVRADARAGAFELRRRA